MTASSGDLFQIYRRTAKVGQLRAETPWALTIRGRSRWKEAEHCLVSGINPHSGIITSRHNILTGPDSVPEIVNPSRRSC